MTRLSLLAVAAFVLGISPCASAHPVPFSYIDVRLASQSLETTVVVHVFDVAHELGIEPPERLLDEAVLSRVGDAIRTLVRDRLQIVSGEEQIPSSAWSAPEPIIERQSLRLRAVYHPSRGAGAVVVNARLFPYDPKHQSFVNFYEQGAVVSQSILDGDHTSVEYFANSPQGVLAVLQRFVPSGIRHILIGPDHLLFLIGLLLLGGSLRQLVLVVTAFTAAHSVTLSLAALNIYAPPAGLVEPAIALSVVYVGADNLLIRDGRDVRAWIAFAFGLIHGFGFANVLREMDLPARSLGWTLFGFNVGVEIGQLFVVVLVASVLIWIRSQSEVAARRLAFAGSLVVMAAGAFWFIQRVFFSGGTV